MSAIRRSYARQFVDARGVCCRLRALSRGLSSPRRRRARARVARTDLPRDLHVLLDVRRRRRHRRRASRLCEITHATTVGARRGSSSKPTRVPSRESLLAECASLPPTRTRARRARAPPSAAVPAATTRRSSRPRYRPKTPALPQDAPPDEQRRSDAADSPGDPQRALPAPGYRDGGTPAPPIRPVRGALRPISTRIDTTASPRKRVSRTAARARDENAFRQHPNLSLRRLFPPAVGSGRALRRRPRTARRAWSSPRTHPLHRRVVSFPRLPRLPDPLRPPRRPLRRRRPSASLFTLGTSAWLWQTLTRARDEEMPLHQNQNPEPGFDPPSEPRARAVEGGVASWATLVDGPPSSLSPSFSRGARRSDAMTAAMTRDDVSAFDATRARRRRAMVRRRAWDRRCGRARRGNGRGNGRERASERPRGERVARRSPRAESSVVAERFDRRRPRRRPRPSSRTRRHSACSDVSPPFPCVGRRDRVVRAVGAGSCTCWRPSWSLDGSWTAAAAAGNAASLASAAVSAASPTLSENYVVSESLEGVESLRSDLFATCPAAGRIQRAPRRRRERARSPPSPPPRSRSSNAAHIAAGALFLASSFAWIVELRAKRRLRREGKGDGRRVRLARDRG